MGYGFTHYSILTNLHSKMPGLLSSTQIWAEFAMLRWDWLANCPREFSSVISIFRDGVIPGRRNCLDEKTFSKNCDCLAFETTLSIVHLCALCTFIGWPMCSRWHL